MTDFPADAATFSEQFKSRLRSGSNAALYGPLIDKLEEHGLKASGSANSKTLQFKWTDSSGAQHALIAFRQQPDRVVSFPKSYWATRRERVGALCERFLGIGEVRVPAGPSGKESFKEVELKKATLTNLEAMIEEVCQYAKAQEA